MILIKRDFKSNFKSFIYWIISIGLLIALLVLVYPVAVEKMNNLGDVIKTMPKELVTAMGLEEYDWKSVLNYISYEFQFMFLACCIYAATLGSSIFSKEESNKTIEFIYSKPITRTQIFFSKVFVIISTLLVFNIILYGITTIFIKFNITNQVVDYANLFNMFIGAFLMQLIFSMIGMVISTVMKKSKSAPMIAAGSVIFTYMIGMFSKIAEPIKNLIYISPIHYYMPDKIVKNGGFENKYLIITVCIVMFSIIFSLSRYKRKDFNI